jgi:GNAT superfamily N-acetyltransferase
MNIQKFDHDEENEFFWSKMGRFFASPKVRASVGGFMTSGPAFTWWVAFDDGGQVMGFCAAKRERGGEQVYLTYAYVLPEHRGKGVYTALFHARQADVVTWPGVKRLHSVVNLHSEPIFPENGFVKCGERGSFTIMEKIL